MEEGISRRTSALTRFFCSARYVATRLATSSSGISQCPQYCYILTIIYAPLALAVKVALLSILVRLYASIYRWMMQLIKAFLVILCCYYTAAMMIKIFMCRPISLYWEDFSESNGSCLNQRAALVADSVISVVSDAGILLLPIPLTWSLRTSRARKLRVIGMLGAGGLATAFSVFRLILVLKRGDTADQTRFFLRLILSGYVFQSSFIVESGALNPS